jgi:hypothetical protein
MKINARLVPFSFVWLRPVAHEPMISTSVLGGAVVADAVGDQPVSFRTPALSRALTLNVYKVEGLRPLAT